MSNWWLKFAKLDIDIAVLSELHFADQGSLLHNGASYTLF